MITPCKMRLPEKDRKEISRRVQECCFANGLKSYQNDTEAKTYNVTAIFIDRIVYRASGFSWKGGDSLPEIDPLDFLKKYEKGEEQLEYFKLDLSDCDPTERKARWEIIKKAISRHARWSIQTESPTAHYGEVGLYSRDSSVSDILEEEITWEYFLDKYVKVKNDAAEILEQLVAAPDDANLQMKTKDARNLFEREQVYADSQVKEVSKPKLKEICYIDDRPMSHRMGWETE